MPVQIVHPFAQTLNILEQQPQFAPDRPRLFAHPRVFQNRPHRVQRGHAGGRRNDPDPCGKSFPHHITDWPNSQHLINAMSQGIDEGKKRRIFCENAGKLYGFIDS